MSLSRELIDWLQNHQNQTCYRAILVLSGPRQEMVKLAEQIVASTDCQQALWVAGENAVNKAMITGIANRQYRQYLGTECEAVVYDAYAGFRANAASALSGTITSGGLMIMICPPLDTWPDFPDPEIAERVSLGFQHRATHSFFLKRLANIILTTKAIGLYQAGQWRLPTVTRAGRPDFAPRPFKTREQQLAVDAINAVLSSDQQAALVLTAHRGRGKSSSLGLAASRWLEEHRGDVLVTAAHPRACSQVFSLAATNMPDVKQRNHKVESANGSVRFVPFDVLLKERPTAHALFIDEAASIPADILARLTDIYDRIVFATTVHGYEGSGRGFEIRFKGHLQSVRPDTQYLHLETPIRWSMGDPLERFWFDACLMDSAPGDAEDTTPDLAPIFIDKKSLFDDEELLRSVFGLLVEAHYQTTPDDLQRIMDSPDHKLFAILQGGKALSVALIVEEPPHLVNIADDIVAGRRRPKGYLLAQSLAIHYQSAEYLSKDYWRVVRIATRAGARRNHFASALLRHLEKTAREHSIAAVGTSFGMTDDLVAFWQKNDFSLIKTGHKRDAASGHINGLYVRALAPDLPLPTT